jgi:tetratricopeptide (TPR) repeat protein
MQRRNLILSFIFISLIAGSCAPTKNTATRRFYQNLVSRYNIYFNGKESIRQGMLQLSNNHKDDYTSILELYRYGSEDEAAGVAPFMERASEKGSKVVLKHSMNFQGVEYNNWVDDSYMMIGKARFFKADYIGAIEMFDFVSKRFSKSEIRYEALLWMAKANLYSGRFQRADVVLGMIEPAFNKNEVSKYVKRNFPIVRAQYLIKTDNLEEASVYLDKALKVKQPRKTKARVLFVSGQVSQRLGQDKKALQYYNACIKSNPPYIMAFHAKIFSAECYDASSGGAENILKQLNKLLKDSKNKDYYDVIYYSLANIELKNNNIPKAIEFLQLSAQSSISNDYQKGISYWKLAELHFDLKKYRESKSYYDSTLISLPRKHEEYNNIQQKSKIMSELIESLNTIQMEDSLQRLAAMSERERLAIIDKLISDIIKAEERQREVERQQQMAAFQQKDPNMQINMAPGSSWYFYNPSAVNFGKNEFRRIWGERRLEDLWRLQNKETSAFGDLTELDEDLDPEIADSIAKLNNPKERAYYLKNIPDTPEKIELSNKKIENAYYKAGTVYKDQLKDFLPASEMFESLLNRFDETEFQLQTYYSLYLIYTNLKLSDKANQYKNLILTKYPDSDFAKIIVDPDYYKKIAEQADEVKLEYKATWELYHEKKYPAVIVSADNALEKYKDPEYLPKFEYLKAASLYKTKGIDSMIVQLEHIIANYPNSEVKPLAEQLLAFVTKGDNEDDEKLEGEGDDDSTQKGPLYVPSSDSYHLFVLAVDVKTANLNAIKASFSDFNSLNFGSQNLTVSTLFLNDKRHMITVSRFNSQTDAENYYKIFVRNSAMQKSLENDFPIYFVISTDNYPVFYKDKDEQAYLDFFRRNYLLR